MATSKKRPAHGTLARFVSGCDCDLCRDASNKYRRDVYRQKAYGRWNPWEPGDAVREHVANLRAVGMSLATIATLARVSSSALEAIVSGSEGRPPTENVTAERARRIYSVRLDLDRIDPRAMLAAAGTARRLQALVAIGWNQMELARRTGIVPRQLGDIIRGNTKKVTAASAVAVRDVYEQLWASPPPEQTRAQRAVAQRARAIAASRKWVPGAAWDDDEIDNPRAKPQGVASGKRRGSLPCGEELLWLVALGETDAALAQRFGVDEGSVQDARYRAERARREAVAA
jgi:plasmid maintenance system antidote protein VapI